MWRSTSLERSQEILATIVRLYIASGEPVASASVARQQRGWLLPATIRRIITAVNYVARVFNRALNEN